MNARRATRALLLVLVCGASFAIVASVLRPLVPWPEERGLRAKYEYVRDHKDEIDAIYVGSSRMMRAIDPRVVDAELAAAGVPWTTFNFGADGMFGFESDFVMREILDLEPARLKMIFFEAATWYPGFDEPGSTNPESLRCAFWHSGAATLHVLESVRLLDAPCSTKCDLYRIHLTAFAKKMSNFGQGPRVLAKVLDTDRDAISADVPADLIAETRGYQPLELLTDRVHTEGREVFLSAIENYKKLIAAIPAENAREISLETYNARALADQYQGTESRGVELVQVVLPARTGSPLFGKLAQSGLIPWLVHFNRPDAYPELYEVEHHYDMGHLNRAGAAVFSRLLARAYLDHREARQ
jgi:hypothetical protein